MKMQKITTFLITCCCLLSLGFTHTFPVKEIDHHSSIKISPDGITISYGISMTEMQAVILFMKINADNNFVISPQEKLDYVAGRADSIMFGILVSLDNKPLQLSNTGNYTPLKPFGMVYHYTVSFPTLSEGNHQLLFRDTNDVALPGKETIQIINAGGISVLDQKKSWRTAEIEFRYSTSPKVSGNYKDDILKRASALPDATDTITFSGNSTAIPEDSIDQAKNWEDGFKLGNSTANDGAYARVKSKIQRTLQGQLTPFIIITTLLLALFIGGLHALQPGHGKTLVAAYLVGARGTIWHAILLGIVVTFTHTFSVLLLGVIVLFLSQYILPETVTLWLTIFSGAVVIVFGIVMFLTSYKRVLLQKHGIDPFESNHDGSHTHFGIKHSHLPGEHSHPHPKGHDHPHHKEHSHGPHEHPHPHEHKHDDHAHENHPHDKHPHPHKHDDSHHQHEHNTSQNPHDHHDSHEHPHKDHHHNHDESHEHQHNHACKHSQKMGIAAQAEKKKISIWSIFSLGIIGGIVPCPDAIVLLLIAVALNRIVFGLLIISVFSLGIAVVLIAIGILMVSAKNFLDRFKGGQSFMLKMPIISALLITLIGFVMLFKALILAGIL
ncbi:MAG: sulfite exporter TauE/SafE family protein [Fibrobacteria bacterium]|nr:sulfite exporter TauE/SafE family protein [Fibrobacteria bacterium]